MGNIIEEIKADLNRYDIVLMILEQEGEKESLTDTFCRSQALNKAKEKVLILSDRDMGYKEKGNWDYRRLDQEALKCIQKLYAMYDFSDQFRMLSYSRQYGTMLNYVKSGMMTMEEFFQCFMDRGQD